jgi:hypothetical protein
MSIKYVYIKNGDGFGNKVFDLIFAIYLYNLYNKKKNKCIINYVLLNSKHESPNDPKIYDIFQKSKKKINFLTQEQYNKVNKNPDIKINKLYDYIKNIDDIPKYDDLHTYTKFNDCFQLVYKMYSTFTNDDKNIFMFNEKIITDDRVFDIKKIDYTVLHIRYGDKLNITKDNILKKNKNINEYIMATPEYYYDMMHKYCDWNNNISLLVIITDSPYVVNHFIANKYQNKNNFIVFNSEWFNSFYLFYYAKVIILNTSTFSLAGALFNKTSKNILLLDNYLNYKENKAPELQNLPNKIIINYDKKYILNYDKKLILKMSKYNIDLKKYIAYRNILIRKNTLKYDINIKNNYKYNNPINSSNYLFSNKIKGLYKFIKFPKNNFNVNNSEFGVELVLDKILNDNNSKKCVFITRDRWLPESKQRLFQFSNIKVNKVYIDRISYNSVYDYNIIYNYINNDSLIFYDIKDDYGVEFDFHYDRYMLKINEYLLKIKNLKLCILVFTPNMLLPFTLKTFINIANHAEKYEFIYTHSGILIIYHNITNYNINIKNVNHKFNKLMYNISYLLNEDIMKEIRYGQINPKSIASTYFTQFNDNIKNNEIKDFTYKLEIIDLDYEVKNDKFINELLPYIYLEFDRLNYYLKLYTIENYKNELLFKNYYTNRNNIWYTLLNEDKHYSDIKQDLQELKKHFIFTNKIIKSRKTKSRKTKSRKTKSRKTSMKLTRKYIV